MKKLLLTITFTVIYTFAFSQLSLMETHQSPDCSGNCNGSISITPINAVGAVTYTWLPLGTSNYNLCAGQYTILAKDAGANTASISVNLPTPNGITTSATVLSNITCFGMSNGSASVGVSGSTGPYIFFWLNSIDSTQTATNLIHGINSVWVIDVNGCIVTETVNIIEPTPINITITPVNATCINSCNGSINTNVIGGTPGYTYMWSSALGSGTGLNTTNPSNLCPDFYSLLVTDAMGCTKTSSLVLNVSSGINSIPNTTISSVSNNETCYLTGDGSIDVTITGSNPGPFIYNWSNGATSQDILNIPTGTYTVSISDASSNCYTIIEYISSNGINCGAISGNVYIDNNSDCIKNSGDLNLMNASIILNPGNRYGYTNAAGDYIINNLPYGTYSLSISNLLTTCNQTLAATVNAGNPNSLNNDLAVAPSFSIQPDMKVSGYSNAIIPGFACNISYVLQNLNMNNASGNFKVTLPSAFIPNISIASPFTYSISGDTIIWPFSNINYTNPEQFIIHFVVPISTPLGSMFNSCAYAQTNIADVNPANNTFCYQRTVTGSYDPNDKTVSPVGVGANGDISATETDLTYLIRFQNTGNGPAVNIFVKDTLSPNVDINTFEMLSASHNYMIDVLPGNILRWKFNNIMLPDSNSNEPGSHGYIQYRIKRNNNNTPGTQIKNTAYIYFDFNEPVVTNTAINTIETITGIKSSSSTNDDWNVYPNPSTGALYIVNSSSVKEESQIQVINSIGQTVLEETITSNYKNVDLSKLNNGVYFVKILSDKHNVIKRVVLSK
jgi:uncharacterized repeat protein (TIGR01451 family)